MPRGDSLNALHRVWMRADVIAASLAINVLALALPIAILQMYDRVIRHQSVNTLAILALITIGAFAMEFFLRVLRSRILSAEGARYDHKTSCSTLEALLASDIDRYRSESPGAHAEKFLAIQNVRAFYCQAALLIADLPFIVIFIGLVAIIAGYMALLPVMLLVIFALLGYAVSKQFVEETGRREASDVKRHNFLVECIGGISTIKSMDAEALMQRRYERLQADAADAFGMISRVTSLTHSMAGELAQAASIATVTVGAIAVVNGELTVGALAATTVLTGRLLQPVLKGLGLWARYPFIRIAEEKLRKIDQLSPRLRGFHPMPRQRGKALVVENMSFAYAGAGRNALTNVSLAIPSNTYIGLTGSTSSGRSTLLKVLAGMLAPTEGSVRYDNVPVGLYDGAGYRRQVTLIAASPTIYAGSLLENLTMFEGGQVQRRALALCRVLGLEDYVAGLPRGLDTVLSGTGDAPLGVAQRIAIIRALAQNPSVVLFDSANAALDHDSDKLLLKYFQRQKGRRSAVFVTDRPSYLKLCDHVFELSDGRVSERQRSRDAAATTESAR